MIWWSWRKSFLWAWDQYLEHITIIYHIQVCKILVVLAFVKEKCSLAGNSHPYFCIKSVHKQTEPFREVTWVEVFLAIIAALYLCAEDCLVSLIWSSDRLINVRYMGWVQVAVAELRTVAACWLLQYSMEIALIKLKEKMLKWRGQGAYLNGSTSAPRGSFSGSASQHERVKSFMGHQRVLQSIWLYCFSLYKIQCYVEV